VNWVPQYSCRVVVVVVGVVVVAAAVVAAVAVVAAAVVVAGADVVRVVPAGVVRAVAAALG
jgi:hypothetical protein